MNLIMRILARLGLTSSLDLRLDELETGTEEGVVVKGVVNASQSGKVMYTTGSDHGGGFSGTTVEYSYTEALNVETQQGTTLVVVNKKAAMSFWPGAEIWAIGRYQTSGRFRADYLIDPRLQTYTDAAKSRVSYITVYALISIAILVSGWYLVLTSRHIFSTQAIIGQIVGYVGLLMTTTGLCILYNIRQRGIRMSRRTSPEQWTRLVRIFGEE